MAGFKVYRIGEVCKLYLLQKRYRPGDDIIGILDFSGSKTICARYKLILKCQHTKQVTTKQNLCLGLLKTDFTLTLPNYDHIDKAKDDNSNNDRTDRNNLDCVLSLILDIVDKDYDRALFEDKAGTAELGPQELDTKPFSCDFPITIYV